MKYKLLVADFDDTTVDDSLIVSESVSRAIKNFVISGGIFTFCTGRMIESIIVYARELGLKGEIIGYQGAEVADILTGNKLYKKKIPNEVAVNLCNYLDLRNEYYQVYDNGKFYVEKDCKNSRDYELFTGIRMNVTQLPLSNFIQIHNLEPTKIMLRIDPDKNQEYIDELSMMFGKVLNVNTSKRHLIEIVEKGVDKGIAVSELCKRLDIKAEETVCIGDALSDVPMIEFAGLGVCVENASECAKRVANLIVPSCAQDGLAYLINNYCL